MSPAMKVDETVEREWLQEIANGDRTAFERFYQAYHRRVFGYLFRMVNSAETAEELATDVLVEVWKGAKRFRGGSRVSTWVLGIARYKALSSLRKSPPPTTDVDEARDLTDGAESQDETLMKSSLQGTIRVALGKLSQKHREVLELTYYQELSCEEIAEVMDCPRNTVKTRMFHARKQLKTLLEVDAS